MFQEYFHCILDFIGNRRSSPSCIPASRGCYTATILGDVPRIFMIHNLYSMLVPGVSSRPGSHKTPNIPLFIGSIGSR